MATWRVLNDMIKKCSQKNFPNYVIRKDKSTSENIKEIVCVMNFLLMKDQIWQKKVILISAISMFFHIEIAIQCSLVEFVEVIDCGLEPFTHICNKSFLSGIFPDKMKMAKVVPVKL